MSKPVTLDGAEAVKHIIQADYAEPEGQVDDNDPVGLKRGQYVESWPTDSGSEHHDRGRLVALSPKEVVMASPNNVDDQEIRIHHPRSNFRVQAISVRTIKL